MWSTGTFLGAFKPSPDPQFIDELYDIVGLYLNPPEAAVVI
jgi:hypothetical protein